MTTNRRSAPYHVGRGRRATVVGASATAPGPRRRPRRLRAPLAGALAALLGTGAGCDVLWRPYIQQLLPDGGAGDDALPATCEQASGGGPQRPGTVTLYLGSDSRKPWTARCELVGDQLVEYLALPSSANNFSQYTAGGAAIGTDVRTTYGAVRIDPVTLKVSCSDQRHATSVGTLSHPNSPDPIVVTSMPYGVAMGCNRSANGVARIDLSGTPFEVAQNGFLSDGISALGTANYSSGNRMVDLTGGGYCGWQDPRPGVTNPINATPKIELQLLYSPM